MWSDFNWPFTYLWDYIHENILSYLCIYFFELYVFRLFIYLGYLFISCIYGITYMKRFWVIYFMYL